MGLAVSTAIGSTGLAAGGTAGALLRAEPPDTNAPVGLPLVLLVARSGAASPLISRPTSHVG